MESAASYFRVSSVSQKTGSSNDNQDYLMVEYCIAEGLNLPDEFRICDNGISAFRKKNRPGFNRIVEIIKNKEVKHIVVYSLSRFARNTRVTLEAVELMIKNGITFHSITEKINTSTPHGRFMITLLASLAQLESEQTGERVKSVKKFCKDKKRTYSKPVFGFDNQFEVGEDGKRKSGKMIVNESEMEVVRLIQEWKSLNISLGKIAGKLNVDNIPTKDNKIWHPSTVKYILENEIYKQKVA